MTTGSLTEVRRIGGCVSKTSRWHAARNNTGYCTTSMYCLCLILELELGIDLCQANYVLTCESTERADMQNLRQGQHAQSLGLAF